MTVETLETSQEGLEGATEATGADQASDQPEGTPEAQNAPETFDREYVESLRAENAETRTKAKERFDTLAAYFVEAIAGDVLVDPSALPWSDEFLDSETGLPDPVKITAAAEALTVRKPYLGKPHGPAGQGEHSAAGADEDVDILALMRRGSS